MTETKGQLMTEQHPLTDGICDQIQDSVHPCDPADMRAAADWQLKQVIEWLKSELGRFHYINGVSYLDHAIDVEYLLDDLKEAMRPTQQQENNFS